MNTKTLLKRIAFLIVSSSLLVNCEDPNELKPTPEINSLQKVSPDINTLAADAAQEPLILLGGTQGIFKASAPGDIFEASNKGLSGNAMTVQAFLQVGSTIYAGTANGIFKSKNGGKSWTASSNGISGLGLNVVTLFERGGVIYAGTFGGGVYKSTDGRNWTTLNSGLTSNLRLTVRAIIEHNGKIFIGTHNGVYRLSTDGTTWRTITTGLDGVNSRTVVGLASKDGSLYAATFGGLLKVMRPGSSTWETLTNGLTDGFVNAVAVVDDKLYVGGNTYGVFVYDGTTFTPFNIGLPSSSIRIRAFAVKGNTVLMSTINSGTYYTTDGTTWIANSGEADNADYWGLLLR